MSRRNRDRSPIRAPTLAQRQAPQSSWRYASNESLDSFVAAARFRRNAFRNSTDDRNHNNNRKRPRNNHFVSPNRRSSKNHRSPYLRSDGAFNDNEDRVYQSERRNSNQDHDRSQSDNAHFNAAYGSTTSLIESGDSSRALAVANCAHDAAPRRRKDARAVIEARRRPRDDGPDVVEERITDYAFPQRVEETQLIRRIEDANVCDTIRQASYVVQTRNRVKGDDVDEARFEGYMRNRPRTADDFDGCKCGRKGCQIWIRLCGCGCRCARCRPVVRMKKPEPESSESEPE